MVTFEDLNQYEIDFSTQTAPFQLHITTVGSKLLYCSKQLLLMKGTYISPLTLTSVLDI